MNLSNKQEENLKIGTRQSKDVIIGVDPGVTNGGFGLIDMAGNFLLCGNMQTYLDADLPWRIEASIVEKQWESGRDTADGRFHRMGKLLQNYGEWRGIFLAQRIPIIEVAAVTWQSYFKLKFRKGMGTNRSVKADMILSLARAMWPGAPLQFKNRDGWASGLLISDWGRGQLKQERLRLK